jgi:hypothetical protein
LEFGGIVSLSSRERTPEAVARSIDTPDYGDVRITRLSFYKTSHPSAERQMGHPALFVTGGEGWNRRDVYKTL